MKPAARRRARECAVQALYSWQLSKNDLADVEHQFLTEQDVKDVDVAYFRELLSGAAVNAGMLDELMAPYLRRRRQCLVCNERFTTFEVAELVMPRVIKSDEVREPFNEDKLRRGMLKALEKRPVSSDDVENALNHIKSQLRATGEREVPTKLVGNLVMDALKKLDKVAYIRFASVYRSFEDVREFGEEIARLQD